MQRPVQITFHDVDHSEALETHIRDKVSKLESFCPQMVGCHVAVEMPHKHRSQGKLFNVRIEAHVPGGEVVVNRDSSEDVYVALRDGFDAAQRQLQSHVSRQRGDTKHHDPTWRQRQRTGASGAEED